MQFNAIFANALHEDDSHVAGLEEDTRGVFVPAVSEVRLEVVDERVRIDVGVEFAHTELGGIGSVEHGKGSLADFPRGNLLDLLASHAIFQFRAKCIGERA